MRQFYIFILILSTHIPVNAQTIDVTSKYELQIKDQKILDALSICFRNFDEYTKANKWNVFKIYTSCLSPDEVEMEINFYSPNDTIQYTQPDNYFKFGEKIAFVYFGKNTLAKTNDPNFRDFILSICRDKMKSNKSNRPVSSKLYETNEDSSQSFTNETKPLNDSKVLPKEMKGLILERTFTFDPSTFKYSIRKIKDRVIITSLKGGEI
jgi:hypothetical protein